LKRNALGAAGVDREAGGARSAERHARLAAASSGSDGHALVDAMVALLIIATTVVLSLNALGIARRAAMAANEVQRAHSLLRQLMMSAPRQFGAVDGRAAGFAWSVETSPTGAEAPVEVCRRAVRAINERSRRAYAISTLEVCPKPEDET
jgi:hypothetical protein